MIGKVTAIVQARMSSTRLPGKVTKKVLGRPLLWHLVERLRRARHVDHILLATTVNPADDPIERLAENLGLTLFRGSEKNVLDRFYQAAKRFQAEYILRITADCPLSDPGLIDNLIEFFFNAGYDYACNCDPPTLPDGLDAEVFSFKALEKTFAHAYLPSELEHVTPYIREHPELFNLGNWAYSPDLSHLRWTVDEPEDFILVREIIQSLYPRKHDFNMEDILTHLRKHPGLIRINSHISRNEGALKTQVADQKYLTGIQREPCPTHVENSPAAGKPLNMSQDR